MKGTRRFKMVAVIAKPGGRESVFIDEHASAYYLFEKEHRRLKGLYLYEKDERIANAQGYIDFLVPVTGWWVPDDRTGEPLGSKVENEKTAEYLKDVNEALVNAISLFNGCMTDDEKTWYETPYTKIEI